MALLKCKCVACGETQYAGYTVYCENCHKSKLQAIAAQARGWQKEATDLIDTWNGYDDRANTIQQTLALLRKIRDADLGGE